MHIGSRGALDIEGLGEKASEALLNCGLLRDEAGLFALTRDDLIKCEFFTRAPARGEVGEQLSAGGELLLEQLDKAKHRPLWRYLVALSIRHVGPTAAQEIAEKKSSIEAIANATPESLSEISGLGPVIAASVFEWFQEPWHKNIVSSWQAAGVQMRDEQSSGGAQKPLSGLTVVITGSLSGFTRESAIEAARSAGAKVASSVSKKTDFCIVGESPGSKAEKAIELGVPVLNQSGFMYF